jgi:hypothetical protein
MAPEFRSDYDIAMVGFPEPAYRFEERGETVFAYTPEGTWKRCRRDTGWGWERVPDGVDKPSEHWEKWRLSSCMKHGKAPEWANRLDE